MTPYEKFLRKSIEGERQHLEQLTQELQKANPFKKLALKRELQEINQNILILSKDLEKYERGLSWLREPTRERDEKAEHLGPVDISAITGQAKPATPTPVGPRPTPVVGAKAVTTSVSVSSSVVSHPQPSSGASQPPQTPTSPPSSQPQAIKPKEIPVHTQPPKPVPSKEENKAEGETQGASSETSPSSSS